MRNYLNFYINGEWVEPLGEQSLDVINPGRGVVVGRVSLGNVNDVDRAVRAARNAFPAWSQTSRDERLRILNRVIEEYCKRQLELAEAITEEMGAPLSLSISAQAPSGLAHLRTAAEVLKGFQFEVLRGTTNVVKEPIGVCGLITPWNWPMNQIACKVAPALATGCTIVLKPSEIAPLSAYIFAEILHAAGVPPGVFNLVNGTGPIVGAAIASHPDVDMVSITGSTRAGIEVAKAAAATVKRVAQELGGKSPIIILDDANLEAAVNSGVKSVMGNAGQSCNAATRMLVPAARLTEIISIVRNAVGSITVGDPWSDVQMGPVASHSQWLRVQEMIASGISQGATLVAGGSGRPTGLDTGCYVRPTVFADVKSSMRIAREEIFGPVLCIISYATDDEAVDIANDTEFGLAAYLWGSDMGRVRRIASQLRAGRVGINGASGDLFAPFGGYKQSGNGREWGEHGFNEFIEVKAMLGYPALGTDHSRTASGHLESVD